MKKTSLDLSSKKPDYLYKKFQRNQRNTAFIVQNRKGISREGFVYRAICLLNKIGSDILNSHSITEFKRNAKDWVKKNIQVKPRSCQKNMRFNQKVTLNEQNEEDVADIASNANQTRITQFFRRV